MRIHSFVGIMSQPTKIHRSKKSPACRASRCVFTPRCVFIHDPRLRGPTEAYLYQNNKSKKSSGGRGGRGGGPLGKDIFYWPDMRRTDAYGNAASESPLVCPCGGIIYLRSRAGLPGVAAWFRCSEDGRPVRGSDARVRDTSFQSGCVVCVLRDKSKTTHAAQDSQ